jgi:membrane protein DedA with SNARE-associated domain
MAADEASFLLALGSSPMMIACAIFLATFVLEDVATAGAALLAAEGTIPPSLALTALFAGIFLGDLALFAAGRAARAVPWVHGWLGEARLAQGQAWLGNRYTVSLIAARFIPGMRLPTFAASGFLHLPFRTFLFVTFLAAFAWTTLAFTAIYMFGTAAAATLGPWRWMAALVLIVLVIAGPRLASGVLTRGSRKR